MWYYERGHAGIHDITATSQALHDRQGVATVEGALVHDVLGEYEQPHSTHDILDTITTLRTTARSQPPSMPGVGRSV